VDVPPVLGGDAQQVEDRDRDARHFQRRAGDAGEPQLFDISPGQLCSLRGEALTISTRGGPSPSWRARAESIASRAAIQSIERS
jgi:hypothetical protein